jgi:serine/threonine-protein kinase
MSDARETERAALRVLREALDFDSMPERERWLARRCTDHPALLERVRAMLQRIGDAGDAERPLDSDPLLDTRLGAFRVVERIGRGGMGVVYRGVREGADFTQDVALKLIRRGFDFDDIRARFLRERRILARLDHPNLARFIDGGVAADGRPWFALEFVRGEPVTHWCDAHRLGIRARVRLFLDVCAAVQHAHAQLVVHRDLKPANILVDAEGRVKLVDFGIAKLVGGDDDDAALTVAGRRNVLTPEYAAPEQFGGDAGAGVTTDVYALGVVAYELVSGVLPCAIDRRDIAAGERAIREQPPQPLPQAILRGGADDAAERLLVRGASLHAYRRRTRGDLGRILEKALAKEPERRYPAVQALADDLRSWLDGRPVRVFGNRFAYRFAKFVARNRAAVAFAGLSLAAVATGIGGMAWKTQAATLAAQRAEAMQSFVFGLFRGASPMATPEHLPSTEDLLAEGARKAMTGTDVAPATRFDMLMTTGRIHLDLRRHAEAAPLLARALELGGTLYGEADTRLLPPLLGLLQAETYQLEINNGAPQDAAAHLQRARMLAALPAADAGDRADVALAECALHQANARQLGDGIDTCRAAVAALEALPSPAPGKVAKAYYLSARTLDLAGAHEEQAIATARRGLQRVRTLGGDTALYDEMSLSAQLSESLAATNRLDEALEQARHANALASRIFPRPHPDHGKLLFDEASLLRKLAREAEAEQRLREALDIYERVYGEHLTLKSADMYWARLNLATSLSGQRRHAEAEQLLRGMIADVEADADFRKQRRTRAQLDANLATTLFGQDRLDEADALIDPVLESFEARDDGIRRGSVPSRAYGLRARILQRRGRPAEAIAWHRHAIAALGGTPSDQGPIAQIQVRLGTAMRDAGQLDEAITTGRTARETQLRLFGETHRGTIEARIELARSLRRAGRVAAADMERAAARASADALAPDDPLRAALD